MSTRRLVVWIVFLGVFAMAARVSVDTDTWWHLRAGQWMVENRAILQTDLFSHTRYLQDWRYPGWLVEIPMYLIYRLAGAGGLNLWNAAMVTLAFALLWPALSGGEFLRAFIVVLAAAASGVYWAARPYLVTFVITALFLQIFEDFHWRGKNRLWQLPFWMVVWANSHGGFAVGFLIWGVYFAVSVWQALPNWLPRIGLALHTGREPVAERSRVIRPLAGCGLLMAAAACLTPVGPRLLLYPFQTVGIGALQAYIQEWQSPDFHDLAVQPFAWMLLLVLGAVGASRRRLALSDFLLTAGFAYLGLLAGRNVALFALAAAPALARHASWAAAACRRRLGWAEMGSREPTGLQKRVNVFLAVLLAVVVVLKAAAVFPESVNRAAFVKFLPVEAVAYLKQTQPPGLLYNSYNWGGYLIWELPEYPVFVDGRTDLYSGEIISEWLSAARAEAGWEAVFERRNINLVLVERSSTLSRVLAADAAWESAYQDELAAVFRRRE